MDKTVFIKDFVEGKVTPEDFRGKLYDDESFEDYFEDTKPIPPYTSRGPDIYLYLLERDFARVNDLIDIKSLLSKYLSQKGIEHKPDTSSLDLFRLVLKVQPSWLDLTSDYLTLLSKEGGHLRDKQFSDWLKRIIKERFIYLKTPPRWLQSPDWPIENGIPLIFVGQLDVTKLYHDTSFVYVFFDKTSQSYRCIVQSM